MQIIQAECGEMIYTFLKRVVDTAYIESTVFTARHNNTEVTVYPAPYIGWRKLEESEECMCGDCN